MNNWFALSILFSVLLVVSIFVVINLGNQEQGESIKDYIKYVIFIIMIFVCIFLVIGIIVAFASGSQYNQQKKWIKNYLSKDIIQVDTYPSEVTIYYKDSDGYIVYQYMQFNKIKYTRKSEKIKTKENGWQYTIYIPIKYYHDVN